MAASEGQTRFGLIKTNITGMLIKNENICIIIIIKENLKRENIGYVPLVVLDFHGTLIM